VHRNLAFIQGKGGSGRFAVILEIKKYPRFKLVWQKKCCAFGTSGKSGEIWDVERLFSYEKSYAFGAAIG